jgi:hypothetical protein
MSIEEFMLATDIPALRIIEDLCKLHDVPEDKAKAFQGYAVRAIVHNYTASPAFRAKMQGENAPSYLVRSIEAWMKDQHVYKY